MPANILRQIVNIIAWIATIVVNALSVTLPIGKATTEQIANRYPIAFLPANFTFGVWGVIYAALLAFTIYQALPSQRENADVAKIGYLFALTAVFNCAWLILFQNLAFAASTIVMLALLVTLIVIYTRLDIGRARASVATRWLIHLPFSLYLGWITVATIANVSYTLYDAGWTGSPLASAAWAVIMLVVASALTGVILYTRRDVAYALVIVWALAGIAVKQSPTPLVSTTATVLAVVVAIGCVATILLRRQGNGSTPVIAPA